MEVKKISDQLRCCRSSPSFEHWSVMLQYKAFDIMRLLIALNQKHHYYQHHRDRLFIQKVTCLVPHPYLVNVNNISILWSVNSILTNHTHRCHILLSNISTDIESSSLLIVQNCGLRFFVD